jgi:hypothetical protein
MKYIIYLTLLIATSCIPYNSNNCFKKTKNGYNIRGFDFENKIDDLHFNKSKSRCGFKKIKGINVWLSDAIFENKNDNIHVSWDITLWDRRISVDFYEANESYVNSYIEKISKDLKI